MTAGLRIPRFGRRTTHPARPLDFHPNADGLAHIVGREFQGEVGGFAEKWDREWIRYFYQHDDRNYFRSLASNRYPFETTKDDVAAFSAEEALSRRIDPEMMDSKLQVFVPGREIVGKDVFEMGCGVGMLGRFLGHLVHSYAGFDYSPLALDIARLTSPPACDYVFAGDIEAIPALYDSADTCLSRHFFIHNNFENSLWVLRMLRDIVRDDGAIHADFFRADGPAERIYPAKSPLVENVASCGFFYTDNDVHELAEACGLRVEKITRVETPPRVFVKFSREPRA